MAMFGSIRQGGLFHAEMMMRLGAGIVAFIGQFVELGTVQYLGNSAKLENFRAGDDAIAGHVILAANATQLSDNVFKTFHIDSGAYLNTISMGLLSHQCMSNLFQTTPDSGVLGSLLSVGFANSTYLNHATQGLSLIHI